MKLRPENIQINQENPFEKDLLNRKQQIENLSKVVQNIEGGFTLSINADWGYGKTTFVKMWEASLQNEGYMTVYFNAWESDFVADPMMALIDGLRSGFDSQDLPQEKLQKLSAFWDVMIGIVKILPFGHAQLIGGVAEITKNGVCKLLKDKNHFQQHQSYKQLVTDFRKQLSLVAHEISGEKQLIVFIDELDRCCPDYAVQMFERIKHFFEVENIIFVISIDKGVICKSIKAVYGGLEIDTEAYLRRFIDLEYDLPEPRVKDFIDAQFEQKGLAIYFTNYEDYTHKTYTGDDREVTLRIALSDCLQAKSKSLRDIEKYFNRLGVILSSKDLQHKYCDITSYLLYLYMFHRDIYDHLRQVDLEVKDMWMIIQEQINSTTVDERSEPFRRYMGMVIGTFAAYIDLVDRKDGYRHEILNDDTQLEWFPKNYHNWLTRENANRKGEVLSGICSHIELLKTTFNWDIVKDVMDT